MTDKQWFNKIKNKAMIYDGCEEYFFIPKTSNGHLMNGTDSNNQIISYFIVDHSMWTIAPAADTLLGKLYYDRK